MSLIYKITRKFQNLIRFEKMNPISTFDFDERFDEIKSINNIDLFKKAIYENDELKEVIWIAIYHCLNTFNATNEFLTVLNKNFKLIADLVEGDERKVIIPNYVKEEYHKGNILATFHNHFEGAILPSFNDFNNSILSKLKFTVITSECYIGIIINENEKYDSKIFQLSINNFKLFEAYLNFCFSNDEFESIKSLEKKFDGDEFKKQREILFDKYVSDNFEKFVVEFNSRMEKFNVYYVYIIL